MVLRWYLFLFSHHKVGVNVPDVLFLSERSLNLFVSSSFDDRRTVVWRAVCCGCWTTLALILGGGWWGSGWASPSQTRSEYRTLWNSSTSSCVLCSCCILSQRRTMHENTWGSVLCEAVCVRNHQSVIKMKNLFLVRDVRDLDFFLFYLDATIISYFATVRFSHSWKESSALEALAKQAPL